MSKELARQLRHVAFNLRGNHGLLGETEAQICERAADALARRTEERTPSWIESPAAQGMHVNPGDELIFRNGRHRILWTVPPLPSSCGPEDGRK